MKKFRMLSHCNFSWGNSLHFPKGKTASNTMPRAVRMSVISLGQWPLNLPFCNGDNSGELVAILCYGLCILCVVLCVRSRYCRRWGIQRHATESDDRIDLDCGVDHLSMGWRSVQQMFRENSSFWGHKRPSLSTLYCVTNLTLLMVLPKQYSGIAHFGNESLLETHASCCWANKAHGSLNCGCCYSSPIPTNCTIL